MEIYNGDYTVYYHMNKINGKIYIGITSQKVLHRWNNGNGYKQNNHFYSAIQKYGWDNFDHIIYASNLTKEEACNMEKLLIEKFNTTDSRYGYNITSGGDAGYALSEETKQKLSDSHKGLTHKVSIGGKEKIRRAQSIPVLCIETGIIYASAIDAERQLGINHSHISRVLKNKRKTTGGYHWKYADVS